jgi:hypothetical protein
LKEFSGTILSLYDFNEKYKLMSFYDDVVTQELPMETPPMEISQPPMVTPEPVANLTYSNPMVNAYMESRKLLESKNAKNT